jgi:hypothetical protein
MQMLLHALRSETRFEHVNAAHERREAMTTNTGQGSANIQGSAKIIPFPVRARKPTLARNEDVQSLSDAWSKRSSVGGAWYHEAAIQESKRAGER